MSFTRIDVNSQPTPAQPVLRPQNGEAFQTRHQAISQPGVLPVVPQKSISESSMSGAFTKKVVLLSLVGVILLGSLTGAGVAYVTRTAGVGSVGTDSPGTAAGTAQQDTTVKVGAIFGLPDESTFKDSTEGVLILGGIEGEGSHTLLRPGGVSQNVYLTSSVVELNQFENARVRIWGETFKGQKAGWLMDIGRVEVLEVGAELPVWYAQQQKK